LVSTFLSSCQASVHGRLDLPTSSPQQRCVQSLALHSSVKLGRYTNEGVDEPSNVQSKPKSHPNHPSTGQLTNLLREGDPAPRFRLPSGSGTFVSLSDFIGKKNLVLYFYPKDSSAGCTREACSFRDTYSAFKELGAEVIGISPDGQSSHEKFARDERLPFTLLSDLDGSVRRAYGVKPSLGLIPGRTTFVIDKQGIIRHIYSSQMHPNRHVGEALTALRSLTNQVSPQPASAVV